MPHFNLTLASKFRIDTSDIDPDLIKEAAQELGMFNDENEDEAKPQSDFSDDEWIEVIKKLLEDDIDSVCDLSQEITAADINVEPFKGDPA